MSAWRNGQRYSRFFEVAESTINNWKIEYPEFLESIKKGKLLADANVANSLYKRALGYEAPDIDIRVIDNQIVETPLIKHYPPDPTSAIFWLKNRQPDKWRDKQIQEVSGTVTSQNINLSNDEFRAIAKELLEKV